MQKIKIPPFNKIKADGKVGFRLKKSVPLERGIH